MSYTPVVPLSGYAGWAFLTRTREAQQEAFDNSTAISRNVAYFTENIGKVRTVEDLVSDRRLLQVALGAFGLEEDIGNKYFLRKVLEDGTLAEGALANRLSDKRYYDFSKAFGFGDFDTPRTVLSTFPEEIVSAYKVKQFEVAVGAQNDDMRLALGLETALPEIATRDTTNNGRWFSVMGQAPVRTVFERALSLPSSVGALDLDQQLTIFRERTEARFGNGEVAQFSDPEKREDLLCAFLLQSELQGFSSTAAGSAGSSALTLLRSSSMVTGIYQTLTLA